MKLQCDVIGTTWEGFQSTYIYELDVLSLRSRAAVTAAVNRRAGDFQSIEDFRLIRRTSSYRALRDGHVQRIVTRVVRPFQLPDSESIFDDAEAA